jgi:ABC-type transport system involved in multi-copper enzyme maturation permease subunit
MLRLLRSEVFRLVRRWMPWVLLLMMVVMTFLLYELIWVTSNAQLQLLRSGTAPATPNAPPPEVQIRSLEAAIQTLRPSRLNELGIGFVTGLGSILMVVFSASHMGTEWAWGTLRTLLASGASRMGFLVSKYVTLVTFAAVYLAIGIGAAVAASFLVSAQAGLDTSGFDPGLVASAAGRGIYGFLPYMALASLIALWFRSAGGGIAAGLVIYFTESIAAGLLISLNRDFATVANLGISRNVQSIARVGVAVQTGGGAGGAGAPLPDQTQAAIVLAAWTLLFVALAVWRLGGRDITLA